MRLMVQNHSILNKRFSELQKHGVFEMDKRTYLINTKNLQENVFKSPMDKTLSATEGSLKRKEYVVTRGSRPLTINIKITSNKLFDIDVDLVPGLDLGDEVVIIPDSITTNPEFNNKIFQRFGLMKWISKEHPCIREEDKDVI